MASNHPVHKANNEIFIPELQRANKSFETILYRGEPHGFSGGGGSPEAEKKFFEDSQAFFAKHLAKKPAAVDPALIREVPARRARPDAKGPDKKP